MIFASILGGFWVDLEGFWSQNSRIPLERGSLFRKIRGVAFELIFGPILVPFWIDFGPILEHFLAKMEPKGSKSKKVRFRNRLWIRYRFFKDFSSNLVQF